MFSEIDYVDDVPESVHVETDFLVDRIESEEFRLPCVIRVIFTEK